MLPKEKLNDARDNIIRHGNSEEFSWVGDWEGPGHGGYLIIDEATGKILEPYEVIDMLERYVDLLKQVEMNIGRGK